MTDSRILADSAARLFDTGRFVEALETAREGLLVDADHAGLLLVEGMACFELGAWEDALESLEEASAQVVLPPLCQLALADLYVRTDRPQTARAMYAFLLEPDRCPPNGLSRVAQGLGRLGDHQAALDVCRRLIELRPAFHSAYFGAAYYLVQLKAPTEHVEPYVRHAFELAPDLISYRVSLALILVELDRSDEAAQLVRSVEPAAIECAGCIRRLLPAIERAGDERLTAEWWTRLLQLEDRSPNDIVKAIPFRG